MLRHLSVIYNRLQVEIYLAYIFLLDYLTKLYWKRYLSLDFSVFNLYTSFTKLLWREFQIFSQGPFRKCFLRTSSFSSITNSAGFVYGPRELFAFTVFPKENPQFSFYLKKSPYFFFIFLLGFIFFDVCLKQLYIFFFHPPSCI